MKTKTIFLWLLLALLVGGVNVTIAANFTVAVSDLKIPSSINANRNINRTIPRLNIEFGGGDGVKFNATDKFLLRSKGTFTLSLRKVNDAARMTSVELKGTFLGDASSLSNYIVPSTGTLTYNSSTLLTWTGETDELTFTSQNNGTMSIESFTITTNDYALDESKMTPSFSFSPALTEATSSTPSEYATTLTSEPGFFDCVTFDAGGTGTTLKSTAFTSGTKNTVYTLTSGATVGNATLTASFAGNDYFNAPATTTYTMSIVATSSKSDMTTFSYNRNDELYTGTAGAIYVNSTAFNTGDSDPFEFVYDETRSILKTKANLDPSIATMGASATSAYFTVESSDATVLDVSEVYLTSANSGTRLYFDNIKVLKAGTANLTYRFLGTDTYNASSFTVTFNIKPHITTYAGSYPYTWDFTTTTSWESSKLRTAYYANRGTWIINNTAEARNLSTNISAAECEKIDKISGLAFSDIATVSTTESKAEGGLALDWSHNWLWLNGKLTVPDLTTNHQVTITAESGKAITVGSSNLTESSGVYTYTPSSDGSVTFTFPGVGIYSIAVTRITTPYQKTYTANLSGGEIDGKIRKLSGTLEFTGAGALDGDTEIEDIPGLKIIMGKSGDSWHVYNLTDSKTGKFNGLVATPVAGNSDISQSIITFKPYVNGFISLRANVYQAKLYEGETLLYTYANNYFNADTKSATPPNEITYALRAGHTYILKNADFALEINQITFRPAFLTVDESGNITNTQASQNSLAPVQVYKDSDRDKYPHLITTTAGQGKVKFSGNREIVNLYDNNDVELIGNGSTVIKGTVLLDGSDEELFTYYCLNATVLELSSTTLEDNAYTDNLVGSSNKYVFTFNQAIGKVSDSAFKVYLAINAEDETDITNKCTVSGSTVEVDFSSISLTEGYSYRIRIADGSVKATASGADAVRNTEIIRTFTINKDLEAPIKMIYPTGIASVGTSVVLETYVYNGSESIGFNDKHKVKARLKKTDGTGDEMLIDASFSGNRIIFKPTSTLNPNTDYTLKILANETLTSVTGGQIVMKEFTKGENKYIYKVTEDKAFYFTTGATAGSVPVATAYSPANDPEGNVPVTAYSSGRISFTFDQNVELEPYSTVYATPINGDESTVSKEMMLSASDSGTKLFVDASGKTVYFDYVSDDLKYDLYYEVLMPVNTVVGAGGKPNSQPVKFRFRMAKNPNATPVDASEFYPHTWDFNKFGSSTVDTKSAYILKNNVGDENKNPIYKVVNALQKSDQDFGTDAEKNNPENYDYRSFSSSGYGFDQGNDVYIATSATSTYKLPEFEGIRVSLAKSLNNRFAIRHTPYKNADNTDKYVFRMNGNTHYMTLSNVPAGKLYMIVNATHLGINSPNAVFETIDGSGQTLSNYNEELSGYTLLSTGGSTKRVVIDVKEAGDVSFCVQNFNCEKIGVAEDEKTFNANFAESGKTYATDRLTYDVRYDLLKAFTDHDVKAYYVSSIADNPSDNTGTITATEVPLTVAKSNQGVMVLYQKALSNNTTVPIFKTDVNSPATSIGETYNDATVANQLKVISSGSTELPSIEDNYYMYVLSNRGSKSEGVAFYRYTGSSFSDRAAYLEVPKYMVNPSISGGSARAFRMVFFDEDGSETTVVRAIEKDGITETVEQAGGYYDLRGLRLAKPDKRGLYIKDGKKIYVK